MKVFRSKVVAAAATGIAALAVSLMVAVGAGARPAENTTATGKGKPKPATLLHPGPALQALAQRARAEGTLNFYTVPPDASVRRVVDAFTKRWGVQATWTRFGTAALQDRFGAESAAGNPRADLILVSNSPWFGASVERRWIIGPKNAGIPGWPTGKVPPLYPKKFLTNSGSAVVQLQPSGIMYNKNAVSAADAPKNWADLLDSKWRGRIILTDPTSSPAFVDLWWTVARRNGGMGYLERLRAQASRLYAGVAPLTQALASGEAAIAVPGVPSIMQPLIDRGRPARHEHAGRDHRPGGRDRDHAGRDPSERGPVVRLLPAHAGRAGAAQRRSRLDLAVGREDRADGLHARGRERVTAAGNGDLPGIRRQLGG